MTFDLLHLEYLLVGLPRWVEQGVAHPVSGAERLELLGEQRVQVE